MLNQPVPLGTGLPDLVLKIENIKKKEEKPETKKIEKEEK